MRQLLNHLWKNNKELATTKSLVNCHSEGVHSILLSDAPGAMVRVFWAVGLSHRLWVNTPAEMYRGLSVGFHPHHCAITLAPLFGSVTNWRVEQVYTRTDDSIPVTKFLFNSKINGGTGGFSRVRDALVSTVAIKEVGPGEWLHMEAWELHTVHVKREESAAWMILEGPENLKHSPVCFSNVNLERESVANLYKPMDPALVRQFMSMVL